MAPDQKLIRIIETAGKLANGMVTQVGKFVSILKGSSDKIEDICTKIEQHKVKYAMELINFSKDLKLLASEYAKVYIKIISMVGYGTKSIPNISECIAKKDYEKAGEEITSFLSGLAGMIKRILDKLEDNIEHVDKSEVKLTELATKNEESKEQVLKTVQADEYFRVGTKTLLVIGGAVGGMFITGANFLLSTYMKDSPGQVLSFMTGDGIKYLDAVLGTTSLSDMRKLIETETEVIRENIMEFCKQVTAFKGQLEIMVADTKDLKECSKDLQCTLDELKTTTDWYNIDSKLQEMLYLFEKLEKEAEKAKTVITPQEEQTDPFTV